MAAWPTVHDLEGWMQGQTPLAGQKLVAASEALEAVTEWIADRCRLYEVDVDGVTVVDVDGDPVRVATIPAPVRKAILLYAAKVYRRKDSPDGVAGMADVGVVRTGRYDSDAESLLGPYTFFGVG